MGWARIGPGLGGRSRPWAIAARHESRDSLALMSASPRKAMAFEADAIKDGAQMPLQQPAGFSLTPPVDMPPCAVTATASPAFTSCTSLNLPDFPPLDASVMLADVAGQEATAPWEKPAASNDMRSARTAIPAASELANPFIRCCIRIMFGATSGQFPAEKQIIRMGKGLEKR